MWTRWHPIVDIDLVVWSASTRGNRLIHRCLPHHPGVDGTLQQSDAVDDFCGHLIVRVHKGVFKLFIQICLNRGISLRDSLVRSSRFGIC